MSNLKPPQTRTMGMQINPLAMIEAHFGNAEEITSEQILKFLCGPNRNRSPTELLAKYREIDESNALNLVCAPADAQILDKVVWPLKHAKAAYMIGNSLATIVLCGVVADMIANLKWRMARVRIMNRDMSEKDEERLFGRTFERLDQRRRVEILKAYGIARGDDATNFGVVAKQRNRYMHSWSHVHGEIDRDARTCYRSALDLVVNAFGQSFDNGKLVLSGDMFDFLVRKDAEVEHDDVDD